MKPSKSLIGWLKILEGYYRIAKQLKGDPKGVINGGHGTIIHPAGAPVKEGDIFTEEYAEYCLAYELSKKCKTLNTILEMYHLNLTQNQFDALACFAYNLGLGYFYKDNIMGDALRSHDMHKVAKAFLVYDKGRKYFLGIPYKGSLPGLTARRKAEKELFEKREA